MVTYLHSETSMAKYMFYFALFHFVCSHLMFAIMLSGGWRILERGVRVTVNYLNTLHSRRFFPSILSLGVFQKKKERGGRGRPDPRRSAPELLIPSMSNSQTFSLPMKISTWNRQYDIIVFSKMKVTQFLWKGNPPPPRLSFCSPHPTGP